MKTRVPVLAVGLALVALQHSLAYTPILDTRGQCTPLAKPVCDAASIQEPTKRMSELRRTIQDGLLSQDGEAREQVFRYLSGNLRWIDLRPYADILLRFSSTDEWKDRGLALLDESELAQSSRGNRLGIYRQASVSGSARLPHGSPCSRRLGIELAALEGLGELKPLAEEYYGMLNQAEQKQLSLERLKVMFALTDGAEDREGAGRQAAERLNQMKDEEFASRMESQDGFAEAVTDIAAYACAKTPFTGASGAGCQAIKEIYARQRRKDVAQHQTARSEKTRVAPLGEGAKEKRWIDRLGRALQPR